MNRFIKFRAWDKEKEKMLFAEGEGITFDFWHDGGWELCEHQLINHGMDNHPLIITDSRGGSVLMQFIGLLDKNGKEIYEGDVVNIGNGFNKRVEWHNARFVARSISPETQLDFLELHTAETEVLGNIYENPELIK